MVDKELMAALDRLGVQVADGSKVYVVVVSPAAVRTRRERRPPWSRPGDPWMVGVCEFFDELMAGTRAPALPCVSSDLYAWYRAWCARSQTRAVSQNKFSHALIKGGRVVVRRKRFMTPEGAVQQKYMHFDPKGTECAYVLGGLHSLGEAVHNFQKKLQSYMEEAA